MLVGQRVFRTRRTNLHEKYDNPGMQTRHLHDRTFGREIARQPDKTAGRRERIRRRSDDVLALRQADSIEVLREAAACHGQALPMQEAAVEQGLQHHRHAADLVHVLGEIAAAGFQVGDERRALEHGGDVEDIERNARFVRHRRQMQSGVGRAAGRGDDGSRVLQGLAGDDIARSQPACEEIHHRLAGQFREPVARLVRRRRAGRAGQRQADRFGDVGHAVGRVLAATGTGRRAGHRFELGQVSVADRSGAVRADCLEDVEDRDVPAAKAPGQDRPTVKKDRRHVEPQHGHHQARQCLVTPGHPDQRVVAVPAHRQFDRIGDGLRLTPERDVARGRLVPGGDDADEGLGDVARRQPHRVEKRTVRRPFGTDRGVAARQLKLVVGRCCSVASR